MAEYVNTLVSPDYDCDPGNMSASGPCLSNDDILAFVQGDWSEEQLGVVHGHVDQCETCQRLVIEAVHALDAEPISESTRPSWNAVFKPNTIVGQRYRVVRLIARGGMGEVYEAFDTELQERIALKTVTSTACDSARAVRSLKAEVHLTRRINHPNVCRIYDFRTHIMEASDAAIHFLVMEFVDGECLGKKLRSVGPLPLEQSLAIARELLHGLNAAHKAGILHRDFKSDNVILRTESEGKVSPVILDFGLAKVLNESGAAATTVTHGHAMVGTIEYMAPEQVSGETLTVASDLYAFGCVCFEMLTGRLPFASDSPAVSAVARLHRSPVAPSSINRDVPQWLDQLVLRCLSRQPQRRFESAEQVLEALASGAVSPPSGRWGQKRNWLAAMLILLAAFVGALLIPPRLWTRTQVASALGHPLRRHSSSIVHKSAHPGPFAVSFPSDPRTLGSSIRRKQGVSSKIPAPTEHPSTAMQTTSDESVDNVVRADGDSNPAPSTSTAAQVVVEHIPKKPDWEQL